MMKNDLINNEILFSVVIPIYNAENVLERTIQSVLNQTYSNFELWLIDDCSTDGSFCIAQEYANIYPQVHAIRLETNSGSAQKPIERGFGMANGEFVMAIGNDDEINEVYLAKMCEIVKNYPDVDIVVPSMQVVDSISNETIGAYPIKSVDTSRIFTGPEACRMIIPQWQFATNGMIIRKNLVGYIHDENPYTYSNSDELTSRILIYHAREVAFSIDSVYMYYQYPTSITHKHSVKLFETLYTDTHLISFSEKYYDEKLAAAMCSKMLSNMKWLYREYQSSYEYTLEERLKIDVIFHETYAFLCAKKHYLSNFRNQLYLLDWHLFKGLCMVMTHVKRIKSKCTSHKQ